MLNQALYTPYPIYEKGDCVFSLGKRPLSFGGGVLSTARFPACAATSRCHRVALFAAHHQSVMLKSSPIYPIFYLLKGDCIFSLRKRPLSFGRVLSVARFPACTPTSRSQRVALFAAHHQSVMLKPSPTNYHEHASCVGGRVIQCAVLFASSAHSQISIQRALFLHPMRTPQICIHCRGFVVFKVFRVRVLGFRCFLGLRVSRV